MTYREKTLQYQTDHAKDNRTAEKRACGLQDGKNHFTDPADWTEFPGRLEPKIEAVIREESGLV